MSNWTKIKTDEDLPNFYTPVFVYCKNEGTTIIACPIEENGSFVGWRQDVNDNYFLKGVELWHPITFPDNPIEDSTKTFNLLERVKWNGSTWYVQEDDGKDKVLLSNYKGENFPDYNDYWVPRSEIKAITEWH